MASPSQQTAQQSRAAALRAALATRVVVADGAMGTMLQAQDPTLEDFEGLEGCNEVLNVTRPDIVRSVHEEYFAAASTAWRPTPSARTSPRWASTTSPSASTSCPRPAPGSPARSPTGSATPDRPRWVLGSVGPGTKLPTLGHVPYAALRDAYEPNAAGLIAGGADALLVETTQDLLQTKAALIGAKRALKAAGIDLPLLVPGHRRDDRHDAARLGDRRRADRAGAAGHRHDRAELRDRPRRDERAPALPRPARPDRAVLHAQRRACRS